MSTKCGYCDNILNFHANKSPCDEVLFESASFIVTTTLGAFVEGWTLVISKRHVTSMSRLSASEIQELSSFVPDVRKRVEQVYGPTIVFEHGSSESGTHFGCGIDHAHIHIVPFKDSIIPFIDKELLGIHWRQQQRLEDIAMENKSYLFVIDQGERNGVISNPESIPSQFMRRILAKYLGIAEYFDYHQYSFDEEASATCRSLRYVFDYASIAGR